MDAFTYKDIVRPTLFKNLEELAEKKALGIVAFGEELSLKTEPETPPVLTIPMVSTQENFYLESWGENISGDFIYGQKNGIAYGANGKYFFCATYIPHLDSYSEKTETLYDNLFELVEELGYPSMVRLWNYIGDILGKNGFGMEVYKDFVSGRAKAFSKRNIPMPAATGIGTRGYGIGIVAIASKDNSSTIHIENPRQMPAYHYPKEYGPRSPSFARATALKHSDNLPNASIFVSETASIVGHKTVFKNDIKKQTQTTLDNISELISFDIIYRNFP